MLSCCASRSDEVTSPQCRAAEKALLDALGQGDAELLDTRITTPSGQKGRVHSIEVAGSETGDPTPVVFLPGYFCGAAIFAFVWENIRKGGSPLKDRRMIAVDHLGWYLSSHPTWTAGVDVNKAENWFVESLEAWRQERNIDVMDLCGHSIGGLVAATYAERCPDHVRTLILLSPAGVPEEPKDFQEKRRGAPWKMKLLLWFWGQGFSPLTGLRLLPTGRAHAVCEMTAQRWSGEKHKVELGAYLYHGIFENKNSGDYSMGALLKPGAWAKRPLCNRVSDLRVKRIEFIYGDRDWMDVRHGSLVAEACKKLPDVPSVWVQLVSGSGHYVHLENVSGFTTALENALTERSDLEAPRVPEIPPHFGDHFNGEGVPAWRKWEGYGFGK